MLDEYARRFREPNAGALYDAALFAPCSFDDHVGRLEITWVKASLKKLGLRNFIHHDFATGTGRILQALAPEAQASYGYDQSPEMLRQASIRVPYAVYKQTSADDVDPIEAGGPVVVTSFRLMLNAPDSTRRSLMQFARAALRNQQGVLVINNHGHRPSLRTLSRLRSNGIATSEFHELSSRDVRQLLREYGFEITMTGGFGLLPRSLYSLSAPWARNAGRAVNEMTASHLSSASSHVVYIARLTT